MFSRIRIGSPAFFSHFCRKESLKLGDTPDGFAGSKIQTHRHALKVSCIFSIPAPWPGPYPSRRNGASSVFSYVGPSKYAARISWFRGERWPLPIPWHAEGFLHRGFVEGRQSQWGWNREINAESASRP